MPTRQTSPGPNIKRASSSCLHRNRNFRQTARAFGPNQIFWTLFSNNPAPSFLWAVAPLPYLEIPGSFRAVSFFLIFLILCVSIGTRPS